MTTNTAHTLDDLILQIQAYAAGLSEPGTNQRLILYMIRESAWRAMMEIDHQNLAIHLAEHAPQLATRLTPQFTVDDL